MQVAGAIRRAVRHPVAIASDRAVFLIDDRKMHSPFFCVGLLNTIKRHRAEKTVAACHPRFWFTLAKDDCIERRAIQRLHADHATAALVQIIKLHPCFERLFLQIDSTRLRREPRIFAVQDEAAIFNLRAAVRGCIE